MIDVALGLVGAVVLGLLAGVTIGDRDIWGSWPSALWVGFILLVLAGVSARLGWLGVVGWPQGCAGC